MDKISRLTVFALLGLLILFGTFAVGKLIAVFQTSEPTSLLEAGRWAIEGTPTPLPTTTPIPTSTPYPVATSLPDIVPDLVGLGPIPHDPNDPVLYPEVAERLEEDIDWLDVLLVESWDTTLAIWFNMETTQTEAEALQAYNAIHQYMSAIRNEETQVLFIFTRRNSAQQTYIFYVLGCRGDDFYPGSKFEDSVYNCQAATPEGGGQFVAFADALWYGREHPIEILPLSTPKPADEAGEPKSYKPSDEAGFSKSGLSGGILTGSILQSDTYSPNIGGGINFSQ